MDSTVMRKQVQLNDIVYFSNIESNDKLTKFASAANVNSDILAKAVEANNNKSHPRNVVAIALAVTTWEWYGANDNGDSFHSDIIPGVLSDTDTLTRNFKTFETRAKVYKFHKSQDEANAVGTVHYAFYNPDQHRVELVIEVEFDKAPSECLKLKRGKALNVSMGAGVRYDVCSYCGHRSYKIEEHCEHIKYQIMELIDGIPVYMINVKPTFFDISIVVIPGDMNAKVMHHIGDDEVV